MRTIEPSGSPRPPSGKITITPESLSHVKERRIALGFPSICKGHAPSNLMALPIKGQENASLQARKRIGLFTGIANQKGSP
jgi:hypothetical protein